MKINEVSKLSGLSVRTLHYYDEINLLKPSKLENGYRIYTVENLNKLQQILFYKEMNFKLNDIAKLLNSGDSRLEILERQRELIIKEKRRFEKILTVIDKTIKESRGDIEMTVEEKFSGFKKEDIDRYENEATKKYGKEVIEEAKKRQNGNEDKMFEQFNDVFFKLSTLKDEKNEVDNEEVQSTIEKLYNNINKYGFNCSLEVFGYIGKGYVANPEFKKNIDKFGEGTAQFVSDAIEIYVDKKKIKKTIDKYKTMY